MISLTITRRDYQRMPQAKLAIFAENVFRNTNGIADYQNFQVRVGDLGAALALYKVVLLDAVKGGESQVLAKNIAKLKLIENVDKLLTSMEVSEGITPQMIVNAGFTLKSKPAPVFAGKLPPPEILRAVTTGNRGQIKVSLKDAFPQAVALHALEYSPDQGVTWINVNYYSSRNFIVDGLPSLTEILIRVKALGRGGNKSEWSSPVMVAVL